MKFLKLTKWSGPNTYGPVIVVPSDKITVLEDKYDGEYVGGATMRTVLHLVGGEQIAVCESPDEMLRLLT